MSLTLDAVNTFLVGLRGPIKQAKVHIIHHLTRQITSLRIRKVPEPQLAKNKRKADRFVEEIKLLKAADKDELARFSLTNSAKVEDVEDLSKRCFVRVANHKSVRPRVAKFKEAHSDHWDVEIRSILTRLGKTCQKKSSGIKEQKKEKLRERAKTLYKTKVKGVNESDKASAANAKDESDSDEASDEEQEGRNEESDNSLQDEKDFVSTLKDLIKDGEQASSGSESSSAEESEEEESEEQDSDDQDTYGQDSMEKGKVKSSSIIKGKTLTVNPPKEVENEDDDDDSDESPDDDTDNDDDDETEASDSHDDSIALRQRRSRRGIMEVKTLNVNEPEEDDDDSEEASEVLSDDTDVKSEVEKTKIPKDSFFLGGVASDQDDNDNNATDDDNDSIREEVPSRTRGYRQDQGRSRGRGWNRGRGSDWNRGRGSGWNRGRGSDWNRGRGRGNRDRGLGNFSTPRGRGHMDRGRGQPNSNPSQLHPSWAAKRKANDINIFAAQGKKKRFDDQPQPAKPDTQSQSPKLHPSWAAKKQSVQIKPFQGKKTVFQ